MLLLPGRCCVQSFLMALQKRPGGVGQRWPRRAIKSFQNLPKNQKRTRWNALLVSPCCRAGATPLVRWAFLFLASRFASPPYLAPGSGLRSAWPFGGLPPGGRYLVRLPCPHPGCCAVFTALLAFAPTAIFYIPLPHAVRCVYRAVLAQDPGRPVRSLGAHRVMHPPAAPPWGWPCLCVLSASATYRLAWGCRGVCCDG